MPKLQTAPHCAKALSFAIAIAIASYGSHAQASDPPQASESRNVALAERRAAEAYEAYARKDYASAVALYLEAYEASPSGIVLYNIARIYDTKLADRQLAMTFYRRYITDPGADTERIKLANQRLTELRAAEAVSAEPGATSSAIPASSAAVDATPAHAREGEGERGGWSATRWTGVTLGALGLGGVAVGTVYGLGAASKAATARQTCDGSRCTTQAGVDAAHAANEKATISSVGFAAGGVLLALGTTLFFVGARSDPERPRAATLEWGASASPSELSLRLKGTW